MTTLKSDDEVKSQLGGSASLWWLIIGICLYLYDGGLRHLLSWGALAFLVIGMFAAATVVGLLDYWLLKHFAAQLAVKHGTADSPAAMNDMRTYRRVFYAIRLVLEMMFPVSVYASFLLVLIGQSAHELDVVL